MLKKLENRFKPQISGILEEDEETSTSILITPYTSAEANQILVVKVKTEALGDGSTITSEILSIDSCINYFKELINKEVITEETAQQFAMSL